MSNKSLGRLTLDLIVNTAGFAQGMNAAERNLDQATREMERKAKARAEAIRGALLSIAAPMAAAFSVGAIATATAALGRQATETVRLAKLTGTTVEEFQRLTFASKNAGIAADKLADIFKDVSDKVGDYITTGGGALKDFFEGVGKEAGVTAESLRHMSGPQALGAIFNALEKSGATRNEMIFWMEALAGDASLLIPLLEQGGKGFQDYGRAAEDVGAILSEDAVRGAAAMDSALSSLGTTTTAAYNIMISQFIPVVGEAVVWLDEFAKSGGLAEIAGQALAEVLKIVVIGMAGVATAIEAMARTVGILAEQLYLIGQFEFGAAADAGNAYFAKLTQSGERLANLVDGLYGTSEAATELETTLTPVVVTAAKLGPAATVAAKGVKALADESKSMADALKAAHAEALAAAETDAELLKIAEEGLDSIREQIQAQKEQNQEFGVTGTALAALRAARLEDTAAQHEQTAAALASIPGNEQQVEAYRAKAEALRELATLQREGAGLEAVQQFQTDFENTAESINQSLSDALFQAFQDGKGFARGLKTTLENYFKTLVLQPLLAPISAGIAGAVTGASGAGGGGNLLTSGLGMAGSLSGLGSAFAGGAGWLFGSGATLGGTLGAAGSLIGMGGASTLSGLALGAGALSPIIAPLALLALSGAFKKPSNKSAGGNVDLGTGQITQLAEMSGDKAPSDETRNARSLLLENLGFVGNQLGATGNIGVDVGGRDGIQINYDGELRKYGSDVNAALRDVYTQMLADTEGIDSEFRDIITSMVESAPESIAGFLTLVQDNFSTLSTDAERFAAVQQGLGDTFVQLGVAVPQSVDEFRALADSLDLTTQGGRDLYGSLSQVAPVFGEVARAIQAALDSISATTANSIRDIQMKTLDDQGKYEFIDQEVIADFAALEMATDPAEVQRLFEEINTGVMEAFNLLTPDEQTRLADAFIARLEEAETRAAERMSIAPLETTAAAAVDGSGITEAVKAGLADAASQLLLATGKQLTSSDLLRDAITETTAAAAANQRSFGDAMAAALASIPGRIVVENRVSVASPEVGYA